MRSPARTIHVIPGPDDTCDPQPEGPRFSRQGQRPCYPAPHQDLPGPDDTRDPQPEGLRFSRQGQRPCTRASRQNPRARRGRMGQSIGAIPRRIRPLRGRGPWRPGATGGGAALCRRLLTVSPVGLSAIPGPDDTRDPQPEGLRFSRQGQRPCTRASHQNPYPVGAKVHPRSKNQIMSKDTVRHTERCISSRTSGTPPRTRSNDDAPSAAKCIL